MVRLPQPGQDIGVWGDILNAYLRHEHRVDGTHEIATMLGAPTTAGRVPVSNPTEDKGLSWQVLTRADVGLSEVDNTKDLEKPLSTPTKQYVDTQIATTVVPDATTTSKGKVQLAGDLSGTAGAPMTKSRTASMTVGFSNADFVCDGTADQVEIQQAITALGANGGTVFLRRGTYQLLASVTLPSGVTLQGEGVATVLQLATAVNQTVIKNADQTNGNTAVTIRNLKIDGNGANQTSSLYGIHLKECTDCTIENIHVTASRGYGVYLEGESLVNKNLKNCKVINCLLENITAVDRDGLHAIYTTNLQVRGCTARNNGRYGLHINRSSEGVFLNCAATANGADGYQLFIVDSCSFVNCAAISNGSEGFQLTSGSHHNSLQACVVKGNGTYGILAGAASTQNEYNQFIGNQIIDNGDDGLPLFYSNYAKAIGNILKGNGDQGIAVDNSVGCQVLANHVEANDTEGIEIKNSAHRCKVIGNEVKNNGQLLANTYAGIRIETGVDGTFVQNNTCYDDQGTKTQQYGIEMQGTADFASIVHNDVRGNAVGGIVVTGNNSSAIDNKGANPYTLYDQGAVSGATTFNRQNGRVIKATLTGNISISLTNGLVKGDMLILKLTQDSVGGRTATWPANCKKAGGSLVLSTAAQAIDLVSLRWDGTDWLEAGRALQLG